MKEGAKHWLWERVTAVALIPLSLWFLASIIAHSASDRGAFVVWLRTPTSTSLMILLLAALFFHISLGLQVIIEDYIHSPVRTVALALMRVGCLVLVAMGGFAVVCIALYS